LTNQLKDKAKELLRRGDRPSEVRAKLDLTDIELVTLLTNPVYSNKTESTQWKVGFF